jgi:hypothetical protein
LKRFGRYACARGRGRAACGVRLSTRVFKLVLLTEKRLSRGEVRGWSPEDVLKSRKRLSFLCNQTVEILNGRAFVLYRALNIFEAIHGRDRARVAFNVRGTSAGECCRRHGLLRNEPERTIARCQILTKKVRVFKRSKLRFDKLKLLHLSGLRARDVGRGRGDTLRGRADSLNPSDIGLSLLFAERLNPSGVRLFGRLFGRLNRKILFLSHPANGRLFGLLSKEDVAPGYGTASARGRLLKRRGFELSSGRGLSDPRARFESGALCFGQGFPGSLASTKLRELFFVCFGEELLRRARLADTLRDCARSACKSGRNKGRGDSDGHTHPL